MGRSINGMTSTRPGPIAFGRTLPSRRMTMRWYSGTILIVISRRMTAIASPTVNGRSGLGRGFDALFTQGPGASSTLAREVAVSRWAPIT
jgi:hypothetical protein